MIPLPPHLQAKVEALKAEYPETGPCHASTWKVDYSASSLYAAIDATAAIFAEELELANYKREQVLNTYPRMNDELRAENERLRAELESKLVAALDSVEAARAEARNAALDAGLRNMRMQFQAGRECGSHKAYSPSDFQTMIEGVLLRLKSAPSPIEAARRAVIEKSTQLYLGIEAYGETLGNGARWRELQEAVRALQALEGQTAEDRQAKEGAFFGMDTAIGKDNTVEVHGMRHADGSLTIDRIVEKEPGP